MQTDLAVLDDLVEVYMLQEELTDKASSAAADSSLPVRRACETVRQLFKQGDVCAAQQAVPPQCQEALKDQRLIFRLKKQQIVEYLRKGTAEAQQQALECIRHDYASLAENAYPEAYGAFKHSMLLLIFDEELQVSPVKEDWSLETRSELAAMLCRTLRQIAGVYPPTLSLLLRHLLLTYQTCRQHLGYTPSAASAEVEDLPGKLLPWSKPKDPPPLPCEDPATTSNSAVGVEDAQSLVTALDLTWEAASHLLRHTRGNLTAAFKDELSAYHLSEKLLDQLVWEYAAHRGLLSLSEADGSTGRAAPSPPSLDSASSPRAEPDRSPGPATRVGSETSLQSAHRQRKVSFPPRADQASKQQDRDQQAAIHATVVTDKSDQPRSPSRQTEQSRHSPHVGSSNSSRKRDAPAHSASPEKQGQNSSQPSSSQRDSSVRSPPRKVPCWKGRAPHPVAPAHPSSSSHQLPAAPFSSATAQNASQHMRDEDDASSCGEQPWGRRREGNCPWKLALPHRERYALLHRLTQMLETGQVELVLQELQTHLQPDWGQTHPALLFELHRSLYHLLLDAGSTDEALRLVRSQLTPLSQQHPQLQPKLKESMASLLPNAGISTSAQQCISLAAGLLQDALRASLGLPQPRLVDLMQMLLEAHQAWYHMQRCKDHFEALLSIDKLKKGSPPAAVPPHPPRRAPVLHPGAGDRVASGHADDVQMADAAGNISSEHESDEADHAMSESEEVVLDDDTIRLTMEFTGLPRHQVIDLLLHNDGDPNAVMAQLFP